MTLTSEQIQNLLEIIDKNQLLIIGKELGEEFLSNEDKLLLEKHGVQWNSLYKPENDTIFTSFHFGMLAEALKSGNFTYNTLQGYIREGKYIPITFREQATINHIKMQTFTDIKNLHGKIFSDVNQILINGSLSQQRDFLKQEIASGIEKKQSMRHIANSIAEKTGDWSRNFDRIVVYNSTNAYEHGKAAMIEKNANEADPQVYKTVFPQACKRCVQLYLTAGIGSQPRIFTLRQLRANGSNIGRKVDEHKATLDPNHPFCRCIVNYLPKGYIWNQEKQRFLTPTVEQYKPNRKPIRIWVNGQEYSV